MNQEEEKRIFGTRPYTTPEIKHPVSFAIIKGHESIPVVRPQKDVRHERLLSVFRARLESDISDAPVERLNSVAISDRMEVLRDAEPYNMEVRIHTCYVSSQGKSLILYATFDLPTESIEVVDLATDIRTGASIYIRGFAHVLSDSVVQGYQFEQAIFIFEGVIDKLSPYKFMHLPKKYRHFRVKQ